MTKTTTVLITGATGFIGKSITMALLNCGEKRYDVVACARNQDKAYEIFREYKENKRLKIVEYCMTEEIHIEDEIDYIIHTAANTSKNDMEYHPAKMLTDNIQGSVQVLELAKKKNVKKILFMSTAQIYGDQLVHGDLQEDYYGGGITLNVNESYAESKRMEEHLAIAYHREYGLNVNILRLFSVYGLGMNMEAGTVFTDLFQDALSGRALMISGSGKGIRNWIYIEDLVEAILLILFNKTEHIVFNVGNKHGNCSIVELAERIRSVFDNRLAIEIENNDINSNKESVQTPNLDRISKLGFKANITLEEGLLKLKEYYKGEVINKKEKR